MNLKLFAGVSYAAILLSSVCANASGDTSAMADNTVQASKTGAVIDDQSQSSADACATVAGAKFAQWNQNRFMVRETRTFADGRRKVVEAIFTPDIGYAREDGGPWSSMNLVQWQRAARSPGDLVRRMGLQECGLSDSETKAKQPVAIYSYGYLPDSRSGQVTGRMWIDNSSQLPIRQELAQTEASQRNVPVSIDASYTYGDAVTVPTDAVRSEERRRWIEQQVFLKNGIGAESGSGGPSPGGHPFGAGRH